MTRTELINKIISKRGYKSYLEIGVRNYYDNCDKIKCVTKHAVDPRPDNKCDFVMTSDKFFSELDTDAKYDLIFIDGLHLTEQVDRDISNSLKHLNHGGTIVMHDCLPEIEENQLRNPVIPQWTGDVWKSVVKCRNIKDITIKVVDTDWGCGIIESGEQEVYSIGEQELNWIWFTENYKSVINVITIEEFNKIYD